MNKYRYIENIFCKELDTDVKGFFSKNNMDILREGATEGIVFRGTEYRPDKLAYFYLGDSKLGWLLTLTNGFINGIEDYYYGRKILIPSPDVLSKLKKE